jgi:hypothetical protein
MSTRCNLERNHVSLFCRIDKPWDGQRNIELRCVRFRDPPTNDAGRCDRCRAHRKLASSQHRKFPSTDSAGASPIVSVPITRPSLRGSCLTESPHPSKLRDLVSNLDIECHNLIVRLSPAAPEVWLATVIRHFHEKPHVRVCNFSELGQRAGRCRGFHFLPACRNARRSRCESLALARARDRVASIGVTVAVSGCSLVQPRGWHPGIRRLCQLRQRRVRGGHMINERSQSSSRPLPALLPLDLVSDVILIIRLPVRPSRLKAIRTPTVLRNV